MEWLLVRIVSSCPIVPSCEPTCSRPSTEEKPSWKILAADGELSGSCALALASFRGSAPHPAFQSHRQGLGLFFKELQRTLTFPCTSCETLQ